MPARIHPPLTRLSLGAGALLVLATANWASANWASARSPVAEPARAGPVSDLGGLLWPAPGNLRRDQAGRPVLPAQLEDRVVVVSFVTTDCAIACVIRTRDLAATARDLPGALRSRVAFLAVSFDPARDDAPALRAFAEGLGLDPAQISVLDGDAAAAAHQRAALRYPPDRTEPPDTVLVFDRTGQLAMSYGGDPLDRPRLARDLATLDRFVRGVGHAPTADTAL